MRSNYSGFPSIAIIEDLEHVFGFEISNEEAENTGTVEEVLDLVSRHAPATGEKCMARMTFFKVRETLATVFNYNRKSLKLDTKIWDSLPPGTWPEKRDLIRKHFARSTLQITSTGSGCALSFLAFLLPLLGSIIAFKFRLVPIIILPVGFIVGVIAAFAAWGLLPPSFAQLPKDLTLRELVAQTLLEEIEAGSPYSPRDLILAVKAIIALHLDHRLEAIELHHHLTDDLDMTD